MQGSGQIVFQQEPNKEQADAKSEVKKESIKADITSNKKFEELAKTSDIILFKASSVFPFDFFPDDITIDLQKVNIIYREFFYSEHIHSIVIQDISDVVLQSNIFFSTLKIIDKGYTENSVDITYLKKSDAMKARRIIQGLAIADREKVDLTKLTKEEVLSQVEKLGEVKTVEENIPTPV